MNIENKSFLAIGAGRINGICFNIVKQLFHIGVKRIAILDVIDPREELQKYDPRISVVYHKVDVRNKDEINIAFAEVLKSFGRVDVLFNGAGIINEFAVEDTLHVNLIGVIYGCQVALEHMSVENGGHGGTIVNIASVAGLEPYFNAPVYCASKHGVIGYTRSLADQMLEPKFGVKFITICPGATSTNLMAEADKAMLRPDLVEQTMQLLQARGIQSAETCAKLTLTAIERSDNGSVWIVDCGNLQRVAPAKFWDVSNNLSEVN